MQTMLVISGTNEGPQQQQVNVYFTLKKDYEYISHNS